jgi:hypothetical protein
MVQLLLSQQASVNARNRRGQTPLFYAERPSIFSTDGGDRAGVARLLREQGGAK